MVEGVVGGREDGHWAWLLGWCATSGESWTLPNLGSDHDMGRKMERTRDRGELCVTRLWCERAATFACNGKKVKFYACMRGRSRRAGADTGPLKRNIPMSPPIVCSNISSPLYKRQEHFCHLSSPSSLPVPSCPPTIEYPKRSGPTAWQLPIAQPGHGRSTFTSRRASTPRPADPSSGPLAALSRTLRPSTKPDGSSRGVLFPHLVCMMLSVEACKNRSSFEWM